MAGSRPKPKRNYERSLPTFAVVFGCRHRDGDTAIARSTIVTLCCCLAPLRSASPHRARDRWPRRRARTIAGRSGTCCRSSPNRRSPIDEIDAEALDDYRASKVQESEVRARAIALGKPRRNFSGQILRPLSPDRSTGRSITCSGCFRSRLNTRALVSMQTSPEVGVGAYPSIRRRPSTSIAPFKSKPSSRRRQSSTETPPEGRRTRSNRGHLPFAGTRAQELCDLVWGDIDLPDRIEDSLALHQGPQAFAVCRVTAYQLGVDP